MVLALLAGLYFASASSLGSTLLAEVALLPRWESVLVLGKRLPDSMKHAGRRLVHVVEPPLTAASPVLIEALTSDSALVMLTPMQLNQNSQVIADLIELYAPLMALGSGFLLASTSSV